MRADKRNRLLAGIFAREGWEWASTGVPTADEIGAKIDQLVERMEKPLLGEPLDWTGTGRLLIRRVRNDGYPYHDTFEILLSLGDADE